MLLRIIFKPEAPFKYMPESFTIFGAICWGIRVLYGEEELEHLLLSFQENPPFFISSPLIVLSSSEILFPKPILKDGWDDFSNIEQYSERKKVKNLKFINEHTFRKVLNGEIESDKELWYEIESEKLEESYLCRINVPHARINRITSTTEGGELYNEEVTFLSKKFVVLIYFKNIKYVDMVKASLKFAQLGGNKTTGMGYYDVTFSEDNSWIKEYINFKSKKFISLSPVIVDEYIDLEYSYYDIVPIMSTVDNFYITVSPFIWKKKIIFISKGSQLCVNRQKEFYGKVKKALINRDTGKVIYQYGLAFPLFVRCKDET